MKKNNYPTIGEKVSYLRNKDAGGVEKGFGVVKAILSEPSPSARILVQIQDEDKKTYNVDIITINCSKETEKAYKSMIKQVYNTTQEGNKVVEKLVSEYNSKCDKLYSALLEA